MSLNGEVREKLNGKAPIIAFTALCITVLTNFTLSIWWASSIDTVVETHIELESHPAASARMISNSLKINTNTTLLKEAKEDLQRMENKLDRLLRLEAGQR